MVEGIEVIVVDNNSTDNTKQIVKIFQGQINNLVYQLEPKIGLSHARNAGYKVAEGEWVLYLDDDAFAFDDMVQRALYLCHLNQYDCIGGMYYGYFEEERPKWIDKDFGTKKLFSNELKPCPFDVPHGGIVIYRKSIIINLQGFNSSFGMIANKLGYGDEIELQQRIEQKGGKIAFDPYLKILHLVKSSRLNIKSILLASYALGKGHKFRSGLSFYQRLIKTIFSIIAIPTIKLPKNLWKLIIIKTYYRQNLVIDTFNGALYHCGRL